MDQNISPEILLNELKAQGLFDKIRKDCISNADTKPAYINLNERVERQIDNYISSQKFNPKVLNLNLHRERLRKMILDSSYFHVGVDRIVEQVIDEGLKKNLPRVNELVYKKLGFEQIIHPKPEVKKENGGELQVKTNLMPTDLDLEAVSPDSDKKSTDSRLSKKKEMDDGEDMEESQEFESPAFEPLEGLIKTECENSQASGISGLTSQEDTVDEKPVKSDTIKMENVDENESQLSQISSNTQNSTAALDINEEAQMPKFNENSENGVETKTNSDTEQKNFDLNKEKYEFTGTERKSLCLEDDDDSKVAVPAVFENKMSVDIDNLYENEATTDSSEDRMQIDLKDESRSKREDETSILSVDQTKKTENSQDSLKHSENEKKDRKDDKKSQSRSSSTHKKKSSHSSSRHDSHSSSNKVKSSTSSSKHESSKQKSDGSSKEREKDRHKSSSSDKNRDSKYSSKSSSSRDKDKERKDREKERSDRDKDKKEKDRKSSSKHKPSSESNSKSKEKTDEKNADDHQQEKAAKKRRSTDHDSNDGQKSLSKNKSLETKESTTSKGEQKSQSNSPGSVKKEKEETATERAQVPIVLDDMFIDGTEFTFDDMNSSHLLASKNNLEKPEPTSILERLLGGQGKSNFRLVENPENSLKEISTEVKVEKDIEIPDGQNENQEIKEEKPDQCEGTGVMETLHPEDKETSEIVKTEEKSQDSEMISTIVSPENEKDSTSNNLDSSGTDSKLKWPISPLKDEDFKGFDNSIETCAKINRYKRLLSYCIPEKEKVEEPAAKPTPDPIEEISSTPIHSKRIRKPNNNYLSQDFCLDDEELDNKRCKKEVTENNVELSEKKETKENKFFQKARNVGLSKPPKKRHSNPIDSSENSKKEILKNQRYSSNDLYKPRLNLSRRKPSGPDSREIE